MKSIKTKIGRVVFPIVGIRINCAIEPILSVSKIGKSLSGSIEVDGVRQGV
jgi:hypothetical protein